MHFVAKRIHLEAGIRIGWLRLPSEGATAIEGAKRRPVFGLPANSKASFLDVKLQNVSSD